MQRHNRHTRQEGARNNRGRDCSDVSRSQGMPWSEKASSATSEPRSQSSSESLERTNPANISISTSSLPNCETISVVSSLRLVMIGYSSPRKLQAVVLTTTYTIFTQQDSVA